MTGGGLERCLSGQKDYPLDLLGDACGVLIGLLMDTPPYLNGHSLLHP